MGRALRKEESEKCKELEQEVLALKSKCRETRTKLEAYEASAKEKAVDTIEDNKEDETTTETTQQQQQQQIEELQAQIEKLEETHITLTESNKKLYHESDKKTTKIAKLEKTIRERDAVIAEKEAKEKEEAENSIQSHHDRKLHIEGLKEEIVQLNSSIEKYKNENKQQSEELSEVRLKVLAKEQEVESTKRMMKETVMQVENKLIRKVDECNQLNEELSLLKGLSGELLTKFQVDYEIENLYEEMFKVCTRKSKPGSLGCAKETIVETEHLLETTRSEHGEVLQQKEEHIDQLQQDVLSKEEDEQRLQQEMLVLLGAVPLVPVKHSGEKASIGVAGGPALPPLKIVGPLIQKGAPALPGDDENVVDDMSVIHGLLYEMVTAVELGLSECQERIVETEQLLESTTLEHNEQLKRKEDDTNRLQHEVPASFYKRFSGAYITDKPLADVDEETATIEETSKSHENLSFFKRLSGGNTRKKASNESLAKKSSKESIKKSSKESIKKLSKEKVRRSGKDDEDA